MSNINTKLIKTFLNLTQHVVPYGTEEKYVVPYLKGSLDKPSLLKKDAFGNYYVKLGESTTLFTSHLDTVSKENKITHVIDEEWIKTDGTTILGGDNKAGVTILIHMINNNVPGLYYFFLGEECGCHGSKWLLENNLELLKKYKRAVAFDRREQGSIITFQRMQRSASDEFANALSSEFKKVGLDYKIDSNGVYTDTAVFIGVIPECTNLSAGVYGEHTSSEKLNIKYFLDVCNVVSKIDWENLPSSRDVTKTEWDDSIFSSRISYGRGDDSELSSEYGDPNFSNPRDYYAKEIYDDYDFMEAGFYPTEREMLEGLEYLLNKRKSKRVFLTDQEETMIYDEYEKITKDYMYVKDELITHGFDTIDNFKVDNIIKFVPFALDDNFHFFLRIDWGRELYINGVLSDYETFIEKVEKMHNRFTIEKIKSKPINSAINNYKMVQYRESPSKINTYMVDNEYDKRPEKEWNFKINKNGSIDTDNVFISDDLKLTRIPFIFNNTKNFVIYHCRLTTLFGGPVYVDGDFKIQSNRLTSLDYSPKKVNGDFWCFENTLPTFEKVEFIIDLFPATIIKGDIKCDKKYQPIFTELNNIVKQNIKIFEDIITSGKLEYKILFRKELKKLYFVTPF